MKKQTLARLLVCALLAQLLLPFGITTTAADNNSTDLQPIEWYDVGDPSGDDEINSTDARIALQVSVQKIVLSEAALHAADVDGSGAVDSTDARWILQYAVKKVDSFPAAGGNTPSTTEPTGTVTTTTPVTTTTTAETPVATTTTTQPTETTTTTAPVTVPTQTTTTIATTTTTTTTTTTMAATTTTTQPENTLLPWERGGTPFVAADEVRDSDRAVNSGLFGQFLLCTEDNAELPYNVACYVSPTYKTVTALLPAGVDTSALIARFTYNGEKVTLGGREIHSGDTLDFRQPFVLTLHANDGSTIDMIVKVETLNTGLPSFCLTTSDYQPITEKELYVTASFYIGGGNAAVCPYVTGESMMITGQAKGRGNTSWGQPKKGYTLKFDQKTALLDMPKSKDWTLIANYEDKSLLRNVTAEYLAEEAGIEYIMKVRPVDLWYNGVYWGTYNLTEKVEIEKTRVDITKYEVVDGVTPAVGQAGFLMEFDSHVNEVSNKRREQWTRPLGADYPMYYDPETDELFFQIDIGGKWLTIKKPDYIKYLINDVEQLRYIYDYVTAAVAALKSEDYARISQYIDVRSFVKWYVVEEFMNNADSSMHSSVYMTLDVGGKLKLGPVWDFDRSSGNCDYWNTQGNPDLYYSGAGWFHLIFRTSEGRQILKEEWAAFYQKIGNLSAKIDEWAAMLEKSQKLNFHVWDILDRKVGSNPDAVVQANTYEKQVTLLKEYLTDRRSRLNEFYQTI